MNELVNGQENSLKLFKNEHLGSVRVFVDDNETPYFCLSDLCNMLDLSAKFVKQRLSDDVCISNYITDRMGRSQSATFINEDGMYDVILDSRKPEARQLRKWVTSEVLPSIRKHGAYMTQQALDRALTDPDYLIQLATMVKEERAKTAELEKQRQVEQQKRIEAEATVQVISEENDLQKDMIEGMTEEVPVAELRQRISRIIQQRGGGTHIQGAWIALFKEFELKYHMRLNQRMERDMFQGNKVEYIDKKLNMIPELFDLTCKLFGEEADKLVKSWTKYIGRPSQTRDLAKRQHQVREIVDYKMRQMKD